VQPVPKAAYRSDFRENTNFCPQRDANLGPLAPQASVLPLDHCDLQCKRCKGLTHSACLKRFFKWHDLDNFTDRFWAFLFLNALTSIIKKLVK